MKLKDRQSRIKTEGRLMRMMRSYAGIKLWAETEKKIILGTLRKVNHAGMTADLLGISRTKLYRKLKDYKSQRSA